MDEENYKLTRLKLQKLIQGIHRPDLFWCGLTYSVEIEKSSENIYCIGGGGGVEIGASLMDLSSFESGEQCVAS